MGTAQVNEIEIEYELDGSGDHLVLLHASQCDRSCFSDFIPRLAEHFTVLSFDQRGSGNSSKPDLPYTMEILANDTDQLMTHLGIEHAHVFGVSLGAMVAQALALHHPKRVNTLILGCTLPGGWSHAKMIDHSEDALIAFSDDETLPPEVRANALAKVAFAPGFAQQHPEMIETLIEQHRAKPIDPVGIKHRLAAIDHFAAYDALPEIHQPTLVITGLEDQLVAWENSKILAEQIPGAEIALYESAGHRFWIEQPDHTLRDILLFIQEHSR